MALLASYEHPILPVRQYNIHQPPAIANIIVTQDGEPLVVPASTYVINEAGAMSGKSPARMYCYNVIALNNFQNAMFDEVVKLCVDAYAYINRGGNSVLQNAGLPEIVRQILTLYTSELILYNPELRMVTPQNVVSGATNNVEALTRVRAEAESLYVQGGVPHHPRAAHPQARGGAPVRVGQGAHANPIATAAVGGRQPQQQQPQRAQNRYPQPNKPQAQATQVSQKPQETKPSGPRLIEGEIEKMDRATHSIVYFGNEYGISTPPLRRRYEEAVERHEQVADQARTQGAIAASDPLVSVQWLAEPSLDELVTATRHKHALKAVDGLQVFLTFGMVLTPVVSSLPLGPLFRDLSKAEQFSDVAVLLRQESKQYEKDPAKLRLALTHVSQIDRKLTALVNDFLSIHLEKFSIGSFIEDVAELLPYLNKKYQNKYNNAFMNFQKRVMSKLFKHSTAAGNGPLEQIGYQAEEDGVYTDGIAVVYSLIYVAATANELGYNVTRQPGTVTKASSPMLHRLLTAVDRTNSALDKPSHFLLVTADDVRYSIYTAVGNEGNFVLVER